MRVNEREKHSQYFFLCKKLICNLYETFKSHINYKSNLFRFNFSPIKNGYALISSSSFPSLFKIQMYDEYQRVKGN